MRVSRRALMLSAGAVALGSMASLRRSFAEPEVKEYRLAANPAIASLTGDGHPDTAVWAYNGKVPGPELRVRQGDPVRIVVSNKLGEDTTVHWHGVRLPNAMDGVPGLTQPPIRPGESFTYEFTPPDAGTFWYHPHADTLQQLGRGLAGALIIEEPEPIGGMIATCCGSSRIGGSTTRDGSQAVSTTVWKAVCRDASAIRSRSTGAFPTPCP